MRKTLLILAMVMSIVVTRAAKCATYQHQDEQNGTTVTAAQNVKATTQNDIKATVNKKNEEQTKGVGTLEQKEKIGEKLRTDTKGNITESPKSPSIADSLKIVSKERDSLKALVDTLQNKEVAYDKAQGVKTASSKPYFFVTIAVLVAFLLMFVVAILLHKKHKDDKGSVKLLSRKKVDEYHLDLALIQKLTMSEIHSPKGRPVRNGISKRKNKKSGGQYTAYSISFPKKLLVHELTCMKDEEYAVLDNLFNNYYQDLLNVKGGNNNNKKFTSQEAENTSLSIIELQERFKNVAIRKEKPDGYITYQFVLKYVTPNTEGAVYYKKDHRGCDLYYLPLPLVLPTVGSMAVSPCILTADKLKEILKPVDEAMISLDNSLKAILLAGASHVSEGILDEAVIEVENSNNHIAFAKRPDETPLHKLLDILWDARQEEKVALQTLLLQSHSTAASSIQHGTLMENALRSTKDDLEKTSKQLEVAYTQVKELKNIIQKNDELVRKAVKAKQDAEDATNIAKDKEQKAQSELKNERDAHARTLSELAAEKYTIERLRTDMKAYTDKLTVMKDLQNLAKQSVNLLASYNELSQLANHLAGASCKGLDDDDYNYYYSRILQKFCASCSLINDEEFQKFTTELNMLAQIGMVPSNGIVQKSVQGSKNAVATLNTILYSKIFKNLVGASIVMSDEFAILLPAMVKDSCPDVSKALKLTKILQESARQMGYNVVYAAPFTKVTSSLKIAEFTAAEIEKDTIFEILHMAVNFGTAKEETSVAAKV